MYCSNCGTHLANSSVICYNCGAKVDAESCSQYPGPKVKPLVDLGRDARSRSKQKKDAKHADPKGSGPSSGFVAPESPSAPSKRAKMPVSKRAIAACCIIVALLVCGACAINELNETVFGPTAFVEEYFTAIAEGDIAKATSMTAYPADGEADVSDPGVPTTTSTSGLSGSADGAFVIRAIEGSLSDQADRITDISVGGIGDQGDVVVDYMIGGKPYHSQITIRESDPRFIFFKGYIVADSAEVAVPLSDYGPNHMLLNGVEFELPSVVNSAYPVSLMCLPGAYTLSAPESDLYTCNDISFTVGSSVVSDAEGAEDIAYGLTIEFSDEIMARANEEVAAYVESRLAHDDPHLEHSPVFARITSNATFTGWGEVASFPQIKVLEGSAREKTNRQLIKAGSVLYAATSGGAVGYTYEYKLDSSDETHKKSDAATIQNMEIYLNLQSGEMDIAYDGVFIRGPLAVEASMQEEGIAKTIMDMFA